MNQLNTKDSLFGSLFRIAGYGLLVLAFLDIVDTFIPLKFSPEWEFGVVGSLVERVPVPLIGVILVFASETNFKIFRLLSRACLLVAVLYLLLLPLGISSALVIDRKNQQQFNNANAQRSLQLQALREQLGKATTAQDLTQLLARINPQAPTPQISNPQVVKTKLIEQLDQAEKRVKAETDSNQLNTRTSLLSKSFKLNLGAIVSSFVFFSLWRNNSKVLKDSRPRK